MRNILISFAGLVLAVLPAAALAQAAPLPACGNFLKAGETIDCACPINAPVRSAWGEGPYTADSDICTAARHAGVIGAAGGGVRATRAAGAEAFAGSKANGITTSNWGRFDVSFTVAALEAAAAACPARLPEAVDEMLCACPSGAAPGSVWGSGPYTADSNICTAARHAGIIAAEGGEVLVRRVAGLGAHEGSIANGVQTSSWGAFSTSLELIAPSRVEVCAELPAEAVTHDCSCPPVAGPSGPVIGRGPYDATGDLCAAARHAGVIAREGGVVHILVLPGLAAYLGSASNGQDSNAGQASARAMVFDANQQP